MQRTQHLALVVGRDRLELATGAPRVVDLAGREHDLDGGRQEARPPQPVRGLAQGPTDRRSGRCRIPLGEPDECPAGLRLEAELARQPVGLLGLTELPTQTMNLAFQVARLRRGRLIHRLLEAPTGAVRLLQRIGPVSLELHQLGAMDEATARERQEVGLALTPTSEGCRPLAGAAKLVDLFTRQDHSAVDDPGDHRRERFGRDRHHRLVQQTEPLPDPPGPDEDVALDVNRKSKQVVVAEALADLRRRGCGGGSAFQIALGFVLEDDRHQHVALLDALALLPIEQPLGAAEPAGGRPHLSAERELDADPERTAHRAPGLARV